MGNNLALGDAEGIRELNNASRRPLQRLSLPPDKLKNGRTLADHTGSIERGG
jgi:hypothetical protein